MSHMAVSNPPPVRPIPARLACVFRLRGIPAEEAERNRRRFLNHKLTGLEA